MATIKKTICDACEKDCPEDQLCLEVGRDIVGDCTDTEVLHLCHAHAIRVLYLIGKPSYEDAKMVLRQIQSVKNNVKYGHTQGVSH